MCRCKWLTPRVVCLDGSEAKLLHKEKAKRPHRQRSPKSTVKWVISLAATAFRTRGCMYVWVQTGYNGAFRLYVTWPGTQKTLRTKCKIKKIKAIFIYIICILHGFYQNYWNYPGMSYVANGCWYTVYTNSHVIILSCVFSSKWAHQYVYDRGICRLCQCDFISHLRPNDYPCTYGAVWVILSLQRD